MLVPDLIAALIPNLDDGTSGDWDGHGFWMLLATRTYCMYSYLSMFYAISYCWLVASNHFYSLSRLKLMTMFFSDGKLDQHK